jgi:deoxyribose-phosphate aldolase
MGTAPGTKLRMKSIVNQCVVVETADNMNGASAATIAAVRTPSRDELLSTKTETASTAVAGGDAEVDFVDEHGSVCSA